MTSRSQARLIRRRCAATVDALAIPVPFELDAFALRVGQRTASRIELVPSDMSVDGPSGVWIGAGKANYFFYERRTSQIHQAHIVLSLAGRLLLSRESGPSADSRLTPALGNQMARLMLGHPIDARSTDIEAETFAMIAADRAALADLALPAAIHFAWKSRPLRSVLGAAVPEAASPALGPRWTHAGLRAYRHVIQIRDCMLALRPFCDHHVAVMAARQASAAGLAGEKLTVAVEAAVLEAAVQARIVGRRPDHVAASTVIHPGLRWADLHSEASWLTAVAGALSANTRQLGLATRYAAHDGRTAILRQSVGPLPGAADGNSQ